MILDENLYDESFGAGLDGIAPAVSQEQLTELGQSDGSEDSAAQAEPEDPLSGLSESERILRSQKLPQNLGGELKQQEYQIILDALIEYRGNRQMVSQKLGISPRTLRYKIAKMREEGMIFPG